ncbi:hypothetical protein V8B97DRAFT_737622 [Scleroderma yunnanense]
MSSPFLPYLVQYYPEIKREHPGEGRRRWRLRVAQQFWQQIRQGHSPPSTTVHLEATENADFVSDGDPLDGISTRRPELGLIVRTDFSDEGAWASFCSRLAEGESDYAAETTSEDIEDGQQSMESTPIPASIDIDSCDDSDDEREPPSIFYIINPSAPHERALLENISNFTALRLLNDVDVRPAPSPPQGTKHVRTPNKLVDLNKWQEIYVGKSIWVYDSKSNVDQCVRLVSQSGDMYGTATGDSWRARVSHICELQVSLFTGQIKIDFGGLDRWDFTERQRNMVEAEQV